MSQEMRDPSVAQIGLAEVRPELTTIVNRTAFGGERFVLTSHGKPRAALVSMADLQRLLDMDYLIKARIEARSASPA